MIPITLTPPSAKPYEVWDDYVPMKTKGRHTDVFLLDRIEAPDNYGKLYNALLEADKGDTFTLHINNGGGYVDSGFLIIDAIENTKATVTAKITGTVASMATLITLACHKVIVGSNVSWLSHNYSGGVQGKGGEIKAEVAFMTKELARSFKVAHKGFFTEEEMDYIIGDQDIWLNAIEVQERLDARRTNDMSKLEKIAAKRAKELKGHEQDTQLTEEEIQELLRLRELNFTTSK